MHRLVLLTTLGLVLWTVPSAAQDYSVLPLEESAPADELSPEIMAELQPAGWKLMRGTNRTVCHLWLRKAWPVKDDFTPTPSLMYPFESGELIGVIRYPRTAGDFRGQEIASGVYTVRYALQPEDGNHVGTSDTRDFLLLLPAAEDRAVAIGSEEELIQLSKNAAGTTHPAMLSLLAAEGESSDLPAVDHDAMRDLWSVRLKNAATGGSASEVVVELVLVGQTQG